MDQRETTTLIRLRSITIIALLAIGAAFTVPTAAVAGPAEEEYRLKYPDAKGGAGSKDGLGVGPRGASAKGLDEDAGNGRGEGAGGGKGSDGNGGSGPGSDDAGAADATGSSDPASAIGDNADSSFTSGGLPILILILAATAAGALGYLAWRRKQIL